MNVFVARQPILDLDEKIYAYELLYRNSLENKFPEIDPDKATIELIVNTFFSIGAKEIAGERVMFINFTGSLLMQDIFRSFDAKKVVIEILEGVEITTDIITKVQELKKQGFKIAMDDFVLQKQYELHSNLFNYVDYLKIDFIDTTAAERLEIENFSRKFENISLVAEKIETEIEFENAKKSGYTLFQGYYFAKPEIIEGFEIPPNIALHYQVIKNLNKVEPNVEEIAELIKCDMSLSFKFLHFINSSAVNGSLQINTINQAVEILGVNEIKKWMHVLAIREIKNIIPSGRIEALIEHSLTRAKICELLAKNAGKKNHEEYFLVGMFSLMDIIMEREWLDILPLMPLSEEIRQTLDGKETLMTPYVKLAEGMEDLNLELIKKYAAELSVDYKKLSFFSQKAHRWSLSLV